MADTDSKTTSKTTPDITDEPKDPTDPIDLKPPGAEDDDDGLLGDVPDAVRKRLEAFVPELVKKTFAAGMGAVFSTEDGLRRITREMKMPKDVAGYLMDTAGNTKDEFMRILAREVREFLQTVNLSEEIAKMLTLLSFEVKTEIRFIPNDEKYGGVEPDVKSSVKLKRSDRNAKQDNAKQDNAKQDNAKERDDDDNDDDKKRRRLLRRRS